MVEVTTTVVTSLTAMKRAAAACTHRRPERGGDRQRDGLGGGLARGLAEREQQHPRPTQTTATAVKSSVVRRVQAPPARRSTRPPSAAPAMKPTSATTGPSTGRSSAPTIAMPRMTTLPVMLPVKTRSRPR